MLELRVLGHLDLRATDPAAARDLLAQPRPTALLVYLASSPTHEFHRRDHLVGLFWPETDQDHARANLRKLVHAIRRALGASVLETRGDEEIRVAPEALWCDAAECDACFAAGRLERAITLYRGPLLPGFVLTGAKGFQDWTELTRRRLSREAVKAAIALAESHFVNEEVTRAGDLAQFIQVAARDLDDEHQFRKLIRLLHRIGDRATALRLYDEFERRVRAEFDTPLSAETQSLMRDIRSD